MACKYVTSKGKTCSIKKVDSEYGICNKHINLFLRKLQKEYDMESDTGDEVEVDMEDGKEMVEEKEKSMEQLMDRVNNKENISPQSYKYKLSERSPLDQIVKPYEQTEAEKEIENKDYELQNKIKRNKDTQFLVLQYGYTICTSIMESLANPYLQDFSKKCSEDEAINQCLKELNEENSIDMLMNASPEIKLLIFTGMVAAKQVGLSLAKGEKMKKNVKTFDDKIEIEKCFEDI